MAWTANQFVADAHYKFLGQGNELMAKAEAFTLSLIHI